MGCRRGDPHIRPNGPRPFFSTTFTAEPAIPFCPKALVRVADLEEVERNLCKPVLELNGALVSAAATTSRNTSIACLTLLFAKSYTSAAAPARLLIFMAAIPSMTWTMSVTSAWMLVKLSSFVFSLASSLNFASLRDPLDRTSFINTLSMMLPRIGTLNKDS